MILAKRLSLDAIRSSTRPMAKKGLKSFRPTGISIVFSWISSQYRLLCCRLSPDGFSRMPLLNGYEATERIRALEKDVELLDRVSHRYNGRIPIFAVSASLFEHQQENLRRLGMDGWILKPIDFKRLRHLLRGVVDPAQREKDIYRPGMNWEIGGWLSKSQLKIL
ncbi:hypothetical protein NUW54_g10413 [Trametes sanguinea]|uniref:Uncharacterized protein n=1 Tax=Trametes sanguinea TaxID=158606 RepID=A0ACC1P0V9_9APHY|nr:hypothetical protein NUW54_g10413 [Trametes sanguinea]